MDEIATLKGGQWPSMVTFNGRTYIMSGKDRGLVWANGEVWERSIRPPLLSPSIELTGNSGDGEPSGTYYFFVRLYRIDGLVYSNPSPLAKTSEDVRYVEADGQAILLTFSEGALDPYDEWHVFCLEANEAVWHRVATVPASEGTYTYNFNNLVLQAAQTGQAADHGYMDDHICPACKHGVVWNHRLWEAGQTDVTLDSTNAGEFRIVNQWFEPDPLIDDEDHQVRPVMLLYPPDVDGYFNGSEPFKQVRVDGMDQVFQADMPLDHRRLRLEGSPTWDDPREGSLDVSLKDPAAAAKTVDLHDPAFTDIPEPDVLLRKDGSNYYTDNGSLSYTFNVASDPTDDFEVGDYVYILDDSDPRVPVEDGARHMLVTALKDVSGSETITVTASEAITKSRSSSDWEDGGVSKYANRARTSGDDYYDHDVDESAYTFYVTNNPSDTFEVGDEVDMIDAASPRALIEAATKQMTITAMNTSSGSESITVELQEGLSISTGKEDAAWLNAEIVAYQGRSHVYWTRDAIEGTYRFFLDDDPTGDCEVDGEIDIVDATPAAVETAVSRLTVVALGTTEADYYVDVTTLDDAEIETEADSSDWSGAGISEVDYASHAYYVDNEDGTYQFWVTADASNTLSVGDEVDILDTDAVAVEQAVVAASVTEIDDDGGEYYVTVQPLADQTLATATNATAWRRCGLCLSMAKMTGKLAGRVWVFATSLNTDGGNPEATPPMNFYYHPDQGAMMPNGLFVQNDRLFVCSKRKLFMGAGSPALGRQIVNWNNEPFDFGLVAPRAMAQVPEDTEGLMQGAVIIPSQHGLYLIQGGAPACVTDKLGVRGWWEALDQDSLENAVGLWDPAQRLYMIRNLALAVTPTDTTLGLVWDLKSNSFLILNKAPATALANIPDEAGHAQIIEGDDMGFLGVGQAAGVVNRGVLLESERQAGTTSAGHTGTLDSLADVRDVNGFEDASASFPTTDDGLRGAYVFVKNASTENVTARRIINNTATRVNVYDGSEGEAWTAPGTSDTYWIGGLHIQHVSGVLGGRDSGKKQLNVLQIFASGPADESFSLRFSFYPAGLERSTSLIFGNTRFDTTLTKALAGGSGVALLGAVSEAFVFVLEGVLLNDDLAVTLLRVAYDYVEGEMFGDDD